MVWSFIGAGTAGGGDNDPLSLTSHANTQVGDLLVVLIEQEELPSNAPATLSGWTALTTGTAPDNQRISTFYRVAGSAGSVGYDWDMDAGVLYTVGIISTFRSTTGVHATPVDADNATNGQVAQSGEFDASAITVSADAATDGALLVGFGAIYGAADSWTPQDGTSEAAENIECCMVYKLDVVSGSTGAITFDSANISVNSVAKLTVFRAAAAGGGGTTTRRYSLSLTGVG